MRAQLWAITVSVDGLLMVFCVAMSSHISKPLF